MRELRISEETYQQLLALKNQWSLLYREVTNKEVVEKIDALKREVFGYGSKASPEVIERISSRKSRRELEAESERFQKALRKLICSGMDFEPEYTMEEHIRRMLSLIEEELGPPLF